MADNTPGNAIPQTPEGLTSLITGLSEQGYTVRTSEQEASFLKNNQDTINTNTRDHWDRIDKQLYELTGKVRPKITGPNGNEVPVKSYVHLDTIVKDQLSQIAQLKEAEVTSRAATETVNAELSALKSENPESKLQETIKGIHEGHATTVAEMQKTIDNGEATRIKDAFAHSIDNVLAEMSFKKDTEMLPDILSAHKAALIGRERKTNENSETYFLNADGTPDINVKDGSYKTISQILAEKLAPIIKSVESQEGTGQKPANGKDGLVAKDNQDVMDILEAEGLDFTSEKGQKRMAVLQATFPK